MTKRKGGLVRGGHTVPAPVVRRLPQYLWYVREQRERNREYVSSEEAAYSLGLTPSTVRQDFTHLEAGGLPKKGYNVEHLDGVLSELLDVGTEKRLVIVGAGNLGRAIGLHGGLRRHGFRVCAIVDVDPEIVGTRIGRLAVRSLDDLVDIVHKRSIDIGVIAVPAEAAQEVADRLILAGVRGLLNLALTRVVAPRRVHVVESRIVLSLLVLACALGQDA